MVMNLPAKVTPSIFGARYDRGFETGSCCAAYRKVKGVADRQECRPTALGDSFQPFTRPSGQTRLITLALLYHLAASDSGVDARSRGQFTSSYACSALETQLADALPAV